MSAPRQPQPRAGSGASRYRGGGAAATGTATGGGGAGGAAAGRAAGPGLRLPPAPAMALPRGFSLILLLLPVLGGPGATITIPQEFLQPPELTEQPPEQLVVFPSDDVVLKCAATGNPPVQYRWTREDEPFVPEEHPGVSLAPGSGTLLINASLAGRLQGRYRCAATNALGTALSTESRVIAENTPQWPKEKVLPVEVEEGDPVVLPCDPPKSAVPPKIYWLNSRIVHIAQDARVSMGQDGFLYFANALVRDSHPDYICHAHYLGPRTIIQKEPLDLRVAPSNMVQFRRPRLVVPRDPQPSHIALRGGTLVLECIAEGLPTPSVRWQRLNGPLPLGRVSLENFNKTLRLRDVEEADDGEYECVAENSQGQARRSHLVTVEAAPYWVRRPQSGLFGPGEAARLDCAVQGKPRPLLSWRINGVPIDEVPGSARRVVRDGALVLSRLEPNDTMVAQCEAHNSHGHLLANAFVYVIELPVKILTADDTPYAVVENRTVFLHCRTFGAPAPTVEWLTPGLEPALQDDRAFVFTNGTLRLGPVVRGDAGTFTCKAHNAHSNDSVSAHLDVRVATRIEVPPQSMTAKKGQTVTFRCSATFDPGLSPRGLVWYRDGQRLQDTADSDKYVLSGDTLTVTMVDYVDQGTFRCRAWTELDAVEAEAQLRVVGRPGPVRDLQVLEVDERQVRLSWTPGDDNNSPVEKFVVEEKEELFGARRFVERVTVPGGQPWAQLTLSPYGQYRFRVLAANAYGRGEPSVPSEPITTAPAAPERNPGGVKGEGNETSNMIITWQPLAPGDWNAAEVRYRVQWRPLEPDGGRWHEETVPGPPVVVAGTPTFSPYEIRVQALNDFGKGPEPAVTIGYSGEDLPLVYPENVGVEILNSTSVRVRWSLTVPALDLRGHLRGFRVLYWHEGWVGERARRQVPPAPPGAASPPPRVLAVPGEARGVLLGGLRPWSRYRLRVLVFNGRGDGPPSDEIHFDTPEGVPGPPEELHVERMNETTLALEWKRPRHPNGVLTGFRLQYRPENHSEEEPPEELSFPAGTLNTTLGRLQPHARYRLALRALSRVGPGAPVLRIGSLRPEPVLPVLGSVVVGEVGEDFTVLHWTLAHPQADIEFKVQYMSKTTEGSWHDSGSVNSSLGLFRLRDLSPGTSYRVQFVGRNHSGHHIPFWESEVQTNGTLLPRPASGFATEGWFIGFVSAVVLLLLLLLILCFIKRSKGGKYSVKDKEDTQADSEARPMKDETFGEYRSLESDGEEKASRSSGRSLGAAGAALGSDDSLAGYGGSADVQFNEDGSFIGQYSGTRGSGPASPGAAAPLD
ncbi:neural cell adhesion molecule L1 isoform X4 [Pezoporus flaviventris]|uniref:neural cell adhesion molecule L1 isoform X4 n=1 Tax=Pezoporus flaviventris TaxID=889875 RepID=UPI002AB06E40|nr:neural cell adhesion molecule L1 isoform X4 [Pezoporus flaviventris]